MSTIKVKKYQVVSVHAKKADRGSRGMALL
jgi:hypothetical protein